MFFLEEMAVSAAFKASTKDVRKLRMWSTSPERVYFRFDVLVSVLQHSQLDVLPHFKAWSSSHF
jgi:hypothetical protein